MKINQYITQEKTHRERQRKRQNTLVNIFEKSNLTTDKKEENY